MWKASPGLCAHVAYQGSYADAFSGAQLVIYGGPEPGSAMDAVLNNDVLCIITAEGGGGINLQRGDTPGVLTKAPNEVWSGEELMAGTATFFRLQFSHDSNDVDISAVRVQGTVGTQAGDMILSDTNFTPGATRTIKHFTIVIPSI